MITKSVHESEHDELNGYEVKQKSIMELKEELSIVKEETRQEIMELKEENQQQHTVIEKLQKILEKHNIPY